MEITLEKIELVKDRTGVTYKEAKEALEAAEGNVVDAIIAIEEDINERGNASIGVKGENLKAKIKEILDKGNVSRVIVSKDGETMLNIPLVVGLLGTVIAPTAAIIAEGFFSFTLLNECLDFLSDIFVTVHVFTMQISDISSFISTISYPASLNFCTIALVSY